MRAATTAQADVAVVADLLAKGVLLDTTKVVMPGGGISQSLSLQGIEPSANSKLHEIWSLLALRRCPHFAVSAVHLSVVVFLAGFKSRAALQVENLALRHQLGVPHRSVKRPKLTAPDRLLWAWLCGVWSDWRSSRGGFLRRREQKDVCTISSAGRVTDM